MRTSPRIQNRLEAGSSATNQRSSRLCSSTNALGCLKNLCVAGPLSSTKQRLREADRFCGELGAYHIDQPHAATALSLTQLKTVRLPAKTAACGRRSIKGLFWIATKIRSLGSNAHFSLLVILRQRIASPFRNCTAIESRK